MIDNHSTTLTQPNTTETARVTNQHRPAWRALIFWLVLFIFCTSGWLALFVTDLNYNYGVSYGDDLPPVKYATLGDLGAHPVGVTSLLHHEEIGSPAIDRSLDMMKAGGFGFVRQLMPWEEVETERGVYNWAKYDNLIQKANDRNLQTFLRLDRPPPWSRLQAMEKFTVAQKRDITGPPDNYAYFYDFAGKVAARYKGKVKYYQIWNEPNLSREWNLRQVEPARYTELLKGAYTAIKAADPDAVVVAAPLAPTDAPAPNMNDLRYLEEMYKAGAKNYFDILGIQIYGLGYDPDFRFVQPDFRYSDLKRINFNRPAYLREIMLRYGDATKSAWASEYGWISVPPDQLNKYNNYWGESVDEKTQARYLVDGIKRIRQEWSWVGLINVWFFRADPNLVAVPDDMSNHWALVRPDFAPRPAFEALKTYNLQPPALTIGSHGIGQNPAYQSTSANSFRVTFEGERANVRLKSDANVQNATFTIDGKNMGKPVANGNLYRGQDVPFGRHTLEVNGVASSDVTGFVISRSNPLDLAVKIGLVVLALGAIGSGGRGGWLFFPVLLGWLRWWRMNFWQMRALWTPFAMVGALALYYFAPVPLAIAGAALFLPLCFIRPDWAIGLAALTAPLYMHPRNLRPGGQLQFTLAEVIIVELAIAGVLTFGWQTWRNQSYKALNWTKLIAWAKTLLPLAAPIAALFLLGTISLLVPESYYLKYALREYRTVIFEPVALFVLTVYFLRRQGSAVVVRLLDFFAVGAVAVSLFGIYQFIFPQRANTSGSALEATEGGCAVATEGVVRVCSVFTHPDNLGLYIGRLLPFLIAFALFYDIQGRFGSRRRILYALALLPVGATLIVSFSRGAWIGTAVAVLGMLILAGARRWLLVYGGFALLGLAALPFIRVERITSLFNFGAGSSGTRLYLWQSAWQMIADKPFTGYGLDQFLYYYNPQYVNPAAWTERFTSHPHNSVLDFWLRLGILGVPLLLWLLGSFFVVAVRLRLRSKTDDKSAKLRAVLAIGLFGSMVHFAVHGLVDNSYFVPDLAIIFCLSFAMLEILRREAVATKENKA